MSKNIAYSDRQIEAGNLIRSAGGDGVSPEVIDEVLNMIGEAENKQVDAPKEDESEIVIKMKLLEETDWRKRAALSAMLISKSLSNY